MDPIPPPAASEFQEQVLRLVQEKRELQDYAERVTRELRRYQLARPPPEPKPEDDMPLPPWATNMAMMSPLLFAYEERISELEAVIERSVALADQAQLLTKENDALRVELQERTEQLRNVRLMAPLSDTGQDGNGEDTDELKELYRLSVDQNEAIAQQNQLLKLQVERMQQTLTATQQQARELQARLAHGVQTHAAEQDRAVKAYNEEKNTAAKKLRAEAERTEMCARQRTAAEQRLDEITGELVEEVRLRENFQIQIDGLHQELVLQTQSLEFYRNSFEDRCATAAEEEERLHADLDKTSQNEATLTDRVLKLEKELTETTDQLFSARRDGDDTKQEAEQMLRVMDCMERRLREIGERHERVQNDLTDKETQLNDLVVLKENWNADKAALKRQIDRLENRLAVETETLKKHREESEHNAQNVQRNIVSELEEKLQSTEKHLLQAQTQVELLGRQGSWEANSMERQRSMHQVERERLAADMNELQQERLRLEKQSESGRRETLRLRDELSAAATKSKEGTVECATELAATRASLHVLERSLGQTREEAKMYESRLCSASTDNARLLGELRDEHARADDLVEAEREKAQVERRTLDRQMQNLETIARQDEQRAVELMNAQEALRQRLQMELALEKEALEEKIQRLSKENHAIREKSRGVLKAVAQRVAMDAGGELPYALKPGRLI